RFGRDFRDNGFRTPDEIDQLKKKTTPPSTPPPAANDFWSFIPDQIPLSIQGKFQAHQNAVASTPACHHAASTGTHISQVPTPCGHDHNGTAVAPANSS